MLRDGHSSGPRITARLKRPTGGCGAPSRHASPGAARRLYREFPPYLVLLRVGFALPAALLRRRCALNRTFHPYLGLAARAVCFLWHFPSNDPAPKSAGALRTLSGTLLASSDFLCLATATVGPAANHFIIVHGIAVQAEGLFPYSCSLGGRANTYTSRAKPINNGIKSDKISRLLMLYPVQKHHETDADGGRDQAPSLNALRGGVLQSFSLSRAAVPARFWRLS